MISSDSKYKDKDFISIIWITIRPHFPRCGWTQFTTKHIFFIDELMNKLNLSKTSLKLGNFFIKMYAIWNESFRTKHQWMNTSNVAWSSMGPFYHKDIAGKQQCSRIRRNLYENEVSWGILQHRCTYHEQIFANHHWLIISQSPPNHGLHFKTNLQLA